MELKQVRRVRDFEVCESGMQLGVVRVAVEVRETVTFKLPESDEWKTAESVDEALKQLQLAKLGAQFKQN